MSSQKEQPQPSPPATTSEIYPRSTLPPLSNTTIFTTLCPAYETAYGNNPAQENSITWLLSQLENKDTFPPNLQRKRILDIGSGTGRPVSSSLAEAGHSVLGIDPCPAMVEFARQNVASLYPDGRAEFVEADARTFNPEKDDPFFQAREQALKAKGETSGEEDPKGYYHAVTAHFSLIVGLETQKEIKDVFRSVYGWLREGGLFVFATTPMDLEGQVIEWMGKPASCSSLTREQALEAIREAGFEIEREVTTKFAPKAVEAGIVKEEEAEKVPEEDHLFVYAVKK